jgi:hypothetical protein
MEIISLCLLDFHLEAITMQKINNSCLVCIWQTNQRMIKDLKIIECMTSRLSDYMEKTRRVFSTLFLFSKWIKRFYMI